MNMYRQRDASELPSKIMVHTWGLMSCGTCILMSHKNTAADRSQKTCYNSISDLRTFSCVCADTGTSYEGSVEVAIVDYYPLTVFINALITTWTICVLCACGDGMEGSNRQHSV